MFYALQSPEFLARFASRSDYYKLDQFYYDRQAFYRKDYLACKINIDTEMNEFSFENKDKDLVNRNFKEIWEMIGKDSEPIIKVIKEKPLEEASVAKLCNDEILKMSLAELFQSVFPKQHFNCDYDKNKFDVFTIKLPNVAKVLKPENISNNEKFIIYNNEKYIPDFYALGKLMTKKLFFFDEIGIDNENFIKVNEDIDLNRFSDLVIILNECQPNTKKAEIFLNKLMKKIDLKRIEDFYKEKFLEDLKNLESSKCKDESAKLVMKISEDSALRYVALAHYKKLLKNCNLAFIYTYSSKLLGRNNFKGYKKDKILDEGKLKEVIKIYKKILDGSYDLVKSDFPVNYLRGNEIVL